MGTKIALKYSFTHKYLPKPIFARSQCKMLENFPYSKYYTGKALEYHIRFGIFFILENFSSYAWGIKRKFPPVFLMELSEFYHFILLLS